jgi:hypothetical protein
MTLKQLFENYTVRLMCEEPGYEWYKMSFDVPAKTPEELIALLNKFRAEAELSELRRERD